MGHGHEVNHGDWKYCKIMGHGYEVYHWTWECSKIIGMEMR